MRQGFVISVFVFFAGASLSHAQTPDVPTDRPVTAATAPQGLLARLGDPVPSGDPQALPSSSGTVDGPGIASSDTSYRGRGTTAGSSGRFWVSAEYLLWRIKGDNLPPLLTTGPVTAAAPGAIGDPGTVVLFGGGNPSRNLFSGGRFTLGFWFDDCQTKGIEANYFFLGSRSNNFTTSSSAAPGSMVLTRPFFDISTGMQSSELISFPGLTAGSFSARTTSALQGAEANMICNLCRSCEFSCDPCQSPRGYRVDFLGGFRFLDLRDGLNISENLQIDPNAPIIVAGVNIRGFDQIDTRNRFYGGQVGLRAEVWRERWFANVTGKAALGVTNQTVDISGFTTLTPPVAGFGGPGDLLALPSNIGHRSRNAFSVVPEVNFNIGYQATKNLRLYAGYNFLYWTHVTRPGDAIDLRVNSTRTPVNVDPVTGLAGQGQRELWVILVE